MVHFNYTEEQELFDWKDKPVAMRLAMNTVAEAINTLKCEGSSHEEACRLVCQAATKWWLNTQMGQ